MTYAQAIAIGSNLEGFVKCTYALIWTKPTYTTHDDPGYVRYFSFQQHNRNRYVTGVGYQALEDDLTFHVFESYPLFELAGTPDPKNPQFIPVRLTQWGYNELIHCVRRPEHKVGILPDTIWYVEDKAVDWMPTDIKNATVVVDGKEIRLDDAIAQAEAEIEKKKKLLIAAGAATLIL